MILVTSFNLTDWLTDWQHDVSFLNYGLYRSPKWEKCRVWFSMSLPCIKAALHPSCSVSKLQDPDGFSAWGFLLEHLSKDWVKSVATSIFYVQSMVQTGLLMNYTLSLYVSLYKLISIVYPFLFLILETRTKKTFSEFSRAAWKQGVFFPSEAKHTRNSFSKNPRVSQLKIKTLFCHFIHHWEIPFGKWICTKQIASEKN